ncbi:MAG: hypothetical protein ABIS92_14700 [Polyangia bacterium]
MTMPRLRTSLSPSATLLQLLPALALGTFSPSCSSSSSNNPAADASTDVATTPLCAADEDVISDFTIDNGVKPVDGRQGGWYTYGDTSGVGTLMPGEGMGVVPDLTQGNASCSKQGSLHVIAKGFMDWGAATGVDLRPQVALDGGTRVKGPYDASKYRGISFWAKAAKPIKFAMVKFLDPYTDTPSVLPADQWCAYKPMMPINCSPYVVKFGYGYTGDGAVAVAADYSKYVNTKIDETWRKFEIAFADAKQDRFNPGLKSPGDKLDTKQLVGFAIQFNTDHDMVPPGATDVEIWIDDVAFMK